LLMCLPLFAEQEAALEWLRVDVAAEEYSALPANAVTAPENVRQALALYNAGEFRRAASVLEKAFVLTLPDGDLDFIAFALAEAYRMLGLKDLAKKKYLFVVENMPESDKTAPAYFRLLQYAYEDRDIHTAEKILAMYEKKYLHHPLRSHVLYTAAKLHYRKKQYGSAVELLGNITSESTHFYQSRFLLALCEIMLKNRKKALLLLEYVRKNCLDDALANEASIVIGDLYYLEGKPTAAQDYYSQVDEGAARYDYALVKIARTFFDMNNYEKSLERATTFIKNNRSSKYFFEMISLIEQSYLELGDTARANSISSIVYQQIVNSRLSFEIYDELTKIAEMISAWKNVELTAMRTGKPKIAKTAATHVGRLRDMEQEHYELLDILGLQGAGKTDNESFDLTLRQYLALLKERILATEEALLDIRGKIEIGTIKLESNPADSSLKKQLADLEEQRDSVEASMRNLEREQAVVIRESMETGTEDGRGNKEAPAKYVDWAFLKYQDKKEVLSQIGTQLYKNDTSATRQDSLAERARDVVRVFSQIDYDKVKNELIRERDLLIHHINTMLEFYPKNKYTPRILFRLAELYFDAASDEFGMRLEEYERRMESKEDTVGIEFPEYDLSQVLRVYDKIIYEFPKHDITDDAYFYKALALQKLGIYDEANDVLQQLTVKFPESEYYVEANMNIGRYYFENPRIEGGKGYRLSEEAFRKVLQYRDHPQFVQALYNLGWCYYMQDHYEDAIAVFKYLIEEVELDFDPTKMDEKQVVNPLLRGEAIDYIAISFDEERRIDDAVKFLELIGNTDYAALVLQRIGELRSEVQDFDVAIKVYRRLLEEYPLSIAAPSATRALITIYEGMNKPEKALEARKAFFRRYAAGTQWRKTVSDRDSTAVQRVDSLAIANGLHVADEYYRRAEKKDTLKYFASAAQFYEKVALSYPEH
ncbi:MAG: tetratricopeptide repeat protein, partial [Chitinivibrionales bacterium]|nr:tetratricopeptide repeat protein [Chitinivibrionales bacterium]